MILYEEFAPGLVLIVHGGTPPSNEDWTGFVAVMKKVAQLRGGVKVIVSTVGGAPNAQQRAEATSALLPYAENVRSAVLSDSAFIRGVVTAFLWLAPKTERDVMKTFKPQAIEKALGWLEMRGVDVPALEQRIDDFHARLSDRVA